MIEYVYMAVEWCGWGGVVLGALLLILYFVQMGYYCGSLSLAPLAKGSSARTEEGISVILPLFSEDYTIFNKLIPSILSQTGVPLELVIVYVGCDKIYFEDLQTLSTSVSQVKTTKISQSELDSGRISPKLAINVGIKAAEYENIILTDAGAIIQSDGWLREMAAGFTRGEVVIGYAGFERGGGLFGALMRIDRTISAVLALPSAAAGCAYRGWKSNMGFKRSVYFASRGFSNLNMNSGIDDLFVQHLAKRCTSSLVLSPASTIRDRRWGSLRWWIDIKSYNHATFSLYNSGARRLVNGHSYSRFLLIVGLAIAIVFMPLWFKVGAAGLLVSRWCWAAYVLRGFGRKVGEGRIFWLLPLYELVIPFVGVAIWLKTLKKDRRVWR